MKQNGPTLYDEAQRRVADRLLPHDVRGQYDRNRLRSVESANFYLSDDDLGRTIYVLQIEFDDGTYDEWENPAPGPNDHRDTLHPALLAGWKPSGKGMID